MRHGRCVRIRAARHPFTAFPGDSLARFFSQNGGPPTDLFETKLVYRSQAAREIHVKSEKLAMTRASPFLAKAIVRLGWSRETYRRY